MSANSLFEKELRYSSADAITELALSSYEHYQALTECGFDLPADVREEVLRNLIQVAMDTLRADDG